MSSMRSRFQGEQGLRLFVQALRGQTIVNGNESLARELAKHAELQEIAEGTALITQDNTDNDIYFVLSGRITVVINKRVIAYRIRGQHIGEMALIDPGAPRCASAIASEQAVVAKISEPAFSSVAESYPQLWRCLAVELSERLRQRNRLIRNPNPCPVFFIGSSVESLPVAREIQSQLRYDEIVVRAWSDGVFGASRFPIDDLEQQIKTSDFAMLVLGPDDKVTSRTLEFNAPRDNVIFELGLFMGALSRQRTFILIPRGMDIKIPTDLLGLTPLEYASTSPHDIAPVCHDLRQLIGNQGPK